jgi:hypothetical protein
MSQVTERRAFADQKAVNVTAAQFDARISAPPEAIVILAEQVVTY